VKGIAVCIQICENSFFAILKAAEMAHFDYECEIRGVITFCGANFLPKIKSNLGFRNVSYVLPDYIASS